MKVATGCYFNMFSEQGYDNYGLKVKFDIMIIFPESFSSELPRDVADTLDFMLEGRLRGIGLEHPFAKKDEIKEAVIKVLESLDYEYERVIVDQGVTYDGLMNKNKEETK